MSSCARDSRWLRYSVECSLGVSSKSFHFMFIRRLFDPQFSSPWSTSFLTFAVGSFVFLSLMPVNESIGAQVSSRSAANTLRTALHSRRGSFETKIDDLAIVDAFEVYNMTVVEWFISPPFLQGRETSAVPFGVCFSQTQSSMEKSRRDALSRFQSSGNRCRKVKEIEIWRACRILQWIGKECCPRLLRTDHSSQENVWLRQDNLKRRLNWTEENGKCKTLTMPYFFKKKEIDMQFREERGRNSVKRINWLVRLEGKRGAHVTYLLWKAKFFGNMVHENGKKLKKNEFIVQRLKQVDNWELQNFLRRRESKFTVIQKGSPFWVARQSEVLVFCKNNSLIPNFRAGLDYLTFPVNPWVFRVQGGKTSRDCLTVCLLKTNHLQFSKSRKFDVSCQSMPTNTNKCEAETSVERRTQELGHCRLLDLSGSFWFESSVQCMRNLCSKLCDEISKGIRLGTAFR